MRPGAAARPASTKPHGDEMPQPSSTSAVLPPAEASSLEPTVNIQVDRFIENGAYGPLAFNFMNAVPVRARQRVAPGRACGALQAPSETPPQASVTLD